MLSHKTDSIMEQLGEYDAETPLSRRYCKQLTEEEYEQQTANTTYDALQVNINVYDSLMKTVVRSLTSGLMMFIKESIARE